jgi:hypothetical protein
MTKTPQCTSRYRKRLNFCGEKKKHRSQNNNEVSSSCAKTRENEEESRTGMMSHSRKSQQHRSVEQHKSEAKE